MDIFEQIGSVEYGPDRAKLYLNLGSLTNSFGTPNLQLVYQCYERARQLSKAAPSSRLHIESLDALAQLYENQKRYKQAITLTEQALEQASHSKLSEVGDVLIALEWRQARLSRYLGELSKSLVAYQRAVESIKQILPDIPIEYDDGSSSFRTTIEPIYLGLIDGLLASADSQNQTLSDATLRSVRDIVELIKQSEMQDYLGDRCTVDDVKGGTTTEIPIGTMVLYPVIFPDRIEILFETSEGIRRVRSAAFARDVRATVEKFAKNLRDGESEYFAQARQLYDWLLRPIEGFINDARIDTLVVVPDGALRLVPMGALYDGKQFVIEKYAVGTVTGMSMTNTKPGHFQRFESLVAGATRFGNVVEKFMQTGQGKSFVSALYTRNIGSGLAQSRMLRSASSRSVPESSLGQMPSVHSVREALELPGVSREIGSLGAILPGTVLLDAGFTVDAFGRAAQSGAYPVVHIASHGIFGGDADSSFVMAYDDVLSLKDLQSLLRSDELRKNPIEILSLSACETAEGNDRAPLGLAGAAIKARARSVLGTLWPVDDEATALVIERFYRGLTQSPGSKARALQHAQIEVLRKEEFAHPFYWAPFALVGNWQ
jgi:CHAT domain-containing protein